MSSTEHTGYLAYFDLMGFSNLIQSESFETQFKLIIKIIENSIKRSSSKLHYHIFSDSLVIYSDTLTARSFFDITRALAEIQYQIGVEMKLTVCGGLSSGKFVIHKHEGNIMFSGKPLVDAVNIEQNQNWLGISISSNILLNTQALTDLAIRPFSANNMDDLNKTLDFPEIVYYVHMCENIPVKTLAGSDLYQGYIIPPQKPNPETPFQAALNLVLFIGYLNVLKLRVSSPHIQSKYIKTIEILEQDIKILKDLAIQKKSISTEKITVS